MASSERPTILAVTLVSSQYATRPGRLDALDLGQVHRWYTDRLHRAGIGSSVGVLEDSLVEHEHNAHPRRWLWHYHGLAFTNDPVGLKNRLTEIFVSDDWVPRPVYAPPWNGRSKWLRYCYKLDSRCRISLDRQVHYDKRHQRLRKRPDSRKLTPDELLELLLFHDKVSLDSRIVTTGAQLRTTSKGCQIVKLRRPKHR